LKENLKNLTSFGSITKWHLLYRASENGFNASSFHLKCNGVQGTLTVIKSNYSNVFGGYTEADWSGNNNYKYDPNAFLFSLTNQNNVSFKMNILDKQHAIYASSSRGIQFGNGSDLACLDNVNCYSNLGKSYQLPSFLAMFRTAQSFLGGSSNFRATEIEVYSAFIDRKLNLII
jgi:hypothetical protein